MCRRHMGRAGDMALYGSGPRFTDAHQSGSTACPAVRKLPCQGPWAKDEVAKAFETLGTAIDRLGQKIGSKVRTATVKLG